MTLFRPAISLFVALSVATGIIHPLAVFAVAQTFFPAQANGSKIEVGGVVVGSRLIGQNFTSPRFFWGRPSATGPYPYNGEASSGSNYGPNHPDQKKAVADRIAALKAADPTNSAPIPVDLVTASGSGLDPEISLAAAYYQAQRVATARGVSLDEIKAAIGRHAHRRLLGFFGEPRVNVLQLNLDIEGKS